MNRTPAPFATIRAFPVPEPVLARRLRWAVGPGLLVIAAAIYLVLGLFGYQHRALAIGALFAALWLSSPRHWPWLFAGTILARSVGEAILGGSSGLNGLAEALAAQSVVHWLELVLVLAGVLLLQRWQITSRTPPSLHQASRLLMAAVVSALAVMAGELLHVWIAHGVGGLRATPGEGAVPTLRAGQVPPLAVFAFHSLLAAFHAILLAAPMLAWVMRGANRAGSAPVLRNGLLVLLPIAVGYLAWAASAPAAELVELVRRLLLVVAVVFAVWHGWRGAVLALWVLSVVTGLESQGLAPLAHPTRMQLFTVVTGATALLFGATVDGLRAQAGQLQRAKEESERLALELNAAAGRNLRTEERERRRLAGELHDEFGQTLTALQTRLMLVAPQLNECGQGAAVDSLLELTRAMRTNISGVLESLRPSALEQLGLYRAIDQGLVRRLAEDAGVQLETVLEGDARLLPRLDDTLRIAAYRLVQEGVTNVVRHAHAGHCRVRLRVNQRAGMLWMFIEIRDDGMGVRRGRAPGRGLANMRDRVLALGGRLHMASQGEGLRLHALLRQPLELAHQAG